MFKHHRLYTEVVKVHINKLWKEAALGTLISGKDRK